jgi:hypothetical protein
VRRDFTAAAPGEKMGGDVTYIPTWQGWLYLGDGYRLPHESRDRLGGWR